MAATKRVAVVTGAARGPGRVVAATLAAEGYNLALVDVVDLEGAAGSLAGPGSILWRTGDVSVEQTVVEFTDEVVGRFGRVDALVNNAVCPGWIKTEMDMEDQGSGAYTDTDITGQVPMARFATPRDVAQAVAFLCDPSRSSYMMLRQLAGRHGLSRPRIDVAGAVIVHSDEPGYRP